MTNWIKHVYPNIYKDTQDDLTLTFFNQKTFWIYQPMLIAYKTKNKTCDMDTDQAKGC